MTDTNETAGSTGTIRDDEKADTYGNAYDRMRAGVQDLVNMPDSGLDVDLKKLRIKVTVSVTHGPDPGSQEIEEAVDVHHHSMPARLVSDLVLDGVQDVTARVLHHFIHSLTDKTDK